MKKYSLVSNIKFMLVLLWKSYKSSVFLCMISIFAGVARPYFSLLLPKVVVDQLSSKGTVVDFIVVVGGTALILAVFQLLDSVAEDKVGYSMNAVLGFATLECVGEKELDIDYELSENPTVCELRARAREMSWGAGADGTNLIKYGCRSAMNILGVIVYGTVILSIHPFVTVLLVLGLLVNMLMHRKALIFTKNAQGQYQQLRNRQKYINRFFSRTDAGKEIRIYAMFQWLWDFASKAREQALSQYKFILKKNQETMLVEGLVVLIRDGAAYIYLIYLVIQNKISIGDFLLVFGVIGSFAGWVSGAIDSINHLLLGSAQVSDFQNYYYLSDKMNRQAGVKLPDKKAMKVKFENVSYTYPGSEKETLHHINLEIMAGEKIAIVGMNGTGKTTFVKLLCGLYQPTKGQIKIEDIPVTAYNRDDYYTLFSAVFQDIYLITDTIACNVSQQMKKDTDIERVKECLRIAGLYDKVMGLEKGLDTNMVKSISKEGIDLSGGELQKLALARALYKNAPIIILDEPTAALDPLAESEIYQKYAEMTKGCTSVFISHRLASTRFCDRILLIGNGGIAEEGTHEELMDKNGIYAEMFMIQSRHYNKGTDALRVAATDEDNYV